MRRSRQPSLALGLAASGLALALGLVACGEQEPTGSTSSPGAEVEAQAEPVVSLANLAGVMTEVTIDQGFAEALGQLGVTAGFLGSATVDGSTVSFPITGGNVTYFDPSSPVRPYVQGSIEHEGSGLSFSAGGTTVELEDYVVDPGESVLTGTVTANGGTVADNANLFFLDGRSLEPLQVSQEEGTAVLAGTRVKLHPDAAKMLRETFQTEEIPDFLDVGTARITLAVPDATPADPAATPSPE